jgi:hypothetical protein
VRPRPRTNPLALGQVAIVPGPVANTATPGTHKEGRTGTAKARANGIALW